MYSVPSLRIPWLPPGLASGDTMVFLSAPNAGAAKRNASTTMVRFDVCMSAPLLFREYSLQERRERSAAERHAQSHLGLNWLCFGLGSDLDYMEQWGASAAPIIVESGQRRSRRPSGVWGRLTFKREPHRVQQCLFCEGLGEDGQGAGAKRPLLDVIVHVCGHDDDRGHSWQAGESTLELQAADPRHFDVHDDARTRQRRHGCQKRFGGIEGRGP